MRVCASAAECLLLLPLMPADPCAAEPAAHVHPLLLRAAAGRQAHTAAHELSEWDARLSAKQQELLLLCRENTSIVNALTDATRAQRSVDAAVLAGRAALAHDPLDGRRATLAQQEQLLAVISGNAAQLDSLRGQIAALKHK